MKRYIKANATSNQVTYCGDPEKLQDKLLRMKQDFRNLAKCETVEDIKSTDWKHFLLTTMVDRGLMKYHGDFYVDTSYAKDIDDFIESWLDDIHECIKDCQKFYVESVKYLEAAENLMNDLYAKLSNMYDIVDFNGMLMRIQPPNGSTHDDCIEFVDYVADVIGGKYIDKNRGTWTLQTDTGVSILAGWDHSYGHKDQWSISAYRGN